HGNQHMSSGSLYDENNMDANQEFGDQHMSNGSLYDEDNMDANQELEDNLDYSDLESIYNGNEFSDDINSGSLDEECLLLRKM
ncbi:11467_t:CDS:2, partial [Racocetra fulgida]